MFDLFLFQALIDGIHRGEFPETEKELKVIPHFIEIK